MIRNHSLVRHALLLLVVLSCVTGPAVAEEKPIGFVSFLKGEVTLIRGETRAPLKLDDQVLKTDVIETAGGKARIIFDAEGCQGMQAVPPNTRFEVGSALGGFSASGITALAPEVLGALADSGGSEMAFGGKRPGVEQKKRILFPFKKMRVPFTRLICLPDPDIASWTFVLKFKEGTKAVQQVFTSVGPGLETGLPAFQAGVPYSLNVTAWKKGGEKAYEDNLLFSIATAKNESVVKQLADVEAAVADAEDPTTHLLKGNVLFKAGFFGDALLEYLDYGRNHGKKDLAIGQLRKTLLHMGFAAKDLDAFPWDALLQG